MLKKTHPPPGSPFQDQEQRHSPLTAMKMETTITYQCCVGKISYNCAVQNQLNNISGYRVNYSQYNQHTVTLLEWVQSKPATLSSTAPFKNCNAIIQLSHGCTLQPVFSSPKYHKINEINSKSLLHGFLFTTQTTLNLLRAFSCMTNTPNSRQGPYFCSVFFFPMELSSYQPRAIWQFQLLVTLFVFHYYLFLLVCSNKAQ